MTTDSFTAKTPSPPYYAVIFTSKRSHGDNGYSEMAERMVQLAKTMPGYLGVESVRDYDGIGITVSYWKDEASIAFWRRNTEHLVAQNQGREIWYERYSVRIAKVDRAYEVPS